MKLFPVNAIFFSLLAVLTFTQAHADAADQGATTTSQNLSAASDPGAQNQKIGDAFMETNAKKQGVVTLPSGLQYEIIDAGKGRKPGPNDTVKVDYEGRLLNGTVFDSSYQRGEPITFPLSGVIAGWQEGLQLMPEGSTWMLYIPANLAYGEAGAGGVIGPNETLIFKVHLIEVK